MVFVRTYRKAFLAVIATVVSGVVAALSDNVLTSAEWLNVAILAVTAAAVFAAPNVPGARYTKAVLAVLGAVLTFLASAIIGGITAAEWGQIVIVALGAVGVYAVPNSRQPEYVGYRRDDPSSPRPARATERGGPAPVSTDNTPRLEDGAQDDVDQTPVPQLDQLEDDQR